jgi:hypothetical protein
MREMDRCMGRRGICYNFANRISQGIGLKGLGKVRLVRMIPFAAFTYLLVEIPIA